MRTAFAVACYATALFSREVLYCRAYLFTRSFSLPYTYYSYYYYSYRPIYTLSLIKRIYLQVIQLRYSTYFFFYLYYSLLYS
jgi:hypothetical protein